MARTKTVSDEDLLEAARAVFLERGFGASTKDIARGAGVSEGVLFQRYDTKAELFFAAMSLPAADLGALLRSPGANGLRGLEAVAGALIEYFRSSMPVLLALTTRPGVRFEEFARRHPDSPLDTLRREVVAFLVRERQADRLADVDPGGAALMVFGLAVSVAFFEALGAHEGRMPDSVVSRAVHALWDGLAPAARKPRRASRKRKSGHR